MYQTSHVYGKMDTLVHCANCGEALGSLKDSHMIWGSRLLMTEITSNVQFGCEEFDIDSSCIYMSLLCPCSVIVGRKYLTECIDHMSAFYLLDLPAVTGLTLHMDIESVAKLPSVIEHYIQVIQKRTVTG